MINIPYTEFEFEVMRASGAGGQSVNRTNSAVQMRWFFQNSQVLSEPQKDKIGKNLSRFITKEGCLVLSSQVHKSQDMNKKECFEKLQGLLKKAFTPVKKRIATKPTFGSKQRRLKEKSIHGEKKRQRRTGASQDE